VGPSVHGIVQAVLDVFGIHRRTVGQLPGGGSPSTVVTAGAGVVGGVPGRRGRREWV
jgi:hypothetical protein